MEVICLEDQAFFLLIEKVVERIKEKENLPEKKWISGEEALRILRLKSKTSLQQIRNNGLIRFSQPQPKVILYDRTSILEYLEKHAKEPF